MAYEGARDSTRLLLLLLLCCKEAAVLYCAVTRCCKQPAQGKGVLRAPHLRVGVVAPPVGPDAGLAAEVPHLELDVFIGHRLDIEADGWGEEGRGQRHARPVRQEFETLACCTGSCTDSSGWFLLPCRRLLLRCRCLHRSLLRRSLGIVDTTSPTCSRSVGEGGHMRSQASAAGCCVSAACSKRQRRHWCGPRAAARCSGSALQRMRAQAPRGAPRPLTEDGRLSRVVQA